VIPSPEDEPLLTVDRVVELTGGVLGQRSAVHEAIRRGEIPSIRIGRKVLVPTARLRSEVLGFEPGRDEGPAPTGPSTTTSIAPVTNRTNEQRERT
jgi:hypothetical protein